MIIMNLPPTPRAASAIIAQMTAKADHETTRYARIDGQEREFTVHYTTEWSSEKRYSDTHSSGYGYDSFALCDIVGAWYENDSGEVVFAGNKAELEALVGDDQVAQWEDEISQSVMDDGEW